MNIEISILTTLIVVFFIFVGLLCISLKIALTESHEEREARKLLRKINGVDDWARRTVGTGKDPPDGSESGNQDAQAKGACKQPIRVKHYKNR
jgi:hypothetical protein